jgi:hypothetical protein
MNRLLISTVVVTVLASACKKGDSTNPQAGNWKVGARSYPSIRTEGGTKGGSNYMVEAISSVDVPFDGISFIFNGTSVPTAGRYKVAGGIPGPGQVSFGTVEGVTLGGPASNYGSTGNDNVDATVTISNGRVSISMPDAWAKSANNDSVRVSANITQTQ